MRVYGQLIAALWFVLFLYWAIAAFSAKRNVGSNRWRAEGGLRVTICQRRACLGAFMPRKLSQNPIASSNVPIGKNQARLEESGKIMKTIEATAQTVDPMIPHQAMTIGT
jgi:hypothetical protein